MNKLLNFKYINKNMFLPQNVMQIYQFTAYSLDLKKKKLGVNLKIRVNTLELGNFCSECKSFQLKLEQSLCLSYEVISFRVKRH